MAVWKCLMQHSSAILGSWSFWCALIGLEYLFPGNVSHILEPGEESAFLMVILNIIRFFFCELCMKLIQLRKSIWSQEAQKISLINVSYSIEFYLIAFNIQANCRQWNKAVNCNSDNIEYLLWTEKMKFIKTSDN